MGITLIDKLKPYLSIDPEDRDSEIIFQILSVLSLMIKKSEEYASKLKQLDIVAYFSKYLNHPTNENLRHQTLTLIGNMAKHSPYFFDDFAVYATFPCLVEAISKHGLGAKNKILKGIVYAIGNVSFYTDR